MSFALHSLEGSVELREAVQRLGDVFERRIVRLLRDPRRNSECNSVTTVRRFTHHHTLAEDHVILERDHIALVRHKVHGERVHRHACASQATLQQSRWMKIRP